MLASFSFESFVLVLAFVSFSFEFASFSFELFVLASFSFESFVLVLAFVLLLASLLFVGVVVTSGGFACVLAAFVQEESETLNITANASARTQLRIEKRDFRGFS